MYVYVYEKVLGKIFGIFKNIFLKIAGIINKF